MREGERDRVSVDVSLCHFISLFVFPLYVYASKTGGSDGSANLDPRDSDSCDWHKG